MFKESYSLELVFSAVITMAMIVIGIRIYLRLINKKSNIRKPDWLSESEFEEKFGKRK